MTNQYIGIDDNLNIMPAYAVDSSKQHAQFDVVLVVSIEFVIIRLFNIDWYTYVKVIVS